MIGLAGLHSNGGGEHRSECIVLESGATIILHIIATVGTWAETGAKSGIAIVHIVDGHRDDGAWQEGDVLCSSAEWPGNARSTDEKSEHIVEPRIHIFGIFIRTEHVTETDGIADRNEIELQHCRIERIDAYYGRKIRIAS